MKLIHTVLLCSGALISVTILYGCYKYFSKIFIGFLSTTATSKSLEEKGNPTDLCLRLWEPSWAPSHYSLSLDPNPNERKFKGSVTIGGQTKKSTSTLELHSDTLIIQNAFVDSKKVHFVDTGDGLLLLNTSNAMSNGTAFKIRVEFEGEFQESNGIVMKTYSKNRYIIVTNLEPNYARRVFPCVDSPRYKATFDIAIRRPKKGLAVLANMPEKESNQGSDWVFFERTPLMPTYLVAFMISDYVPHRVNAANYSLTTQLNIWVPKEDQGTRAVKWAAALTPLLLSALQEYLYSNFTLPKLDQFPTPNIEDDMNGMENWGLIMYRRSAFLRDKMSSTTKEIQTLYTITHEIAHNWFGNLITVKDWCSSWIQEALPTFLHGRIPTQLFMDIDVVNYIKWQARSDVMTYECTKDSKEHLRRLNIKHPDNNTALFVPSDYSKGATLLYMMESVVTPTVFKKALQEFIKNNEYGSITDKDLWGAIQQTVDEEEIILPDSVENIIDGWVNDVSHPIVQVTRQKKTGRLMVTQSYCAPLEETSEFWIPLTYTTSREQNFNDSRVKFWVSKESSAFLNVTLKPDEWIVINIKNSGMYRVNYDRDTWRSITNQLKVNHEVIHPINRAILLDDAFTLSRTGRVNFTVPLELISYMKRERSAYVWEAAWTTFTDFCVFLNAGDKKLFQEYLYSLIKPVFREVSTNWDNYERRLSEFEERQLRGSVLHLADWISYPEYIDFTKQMVDDILEGRLNESKIPYEVDMEAVETKAVAEGNLRLFNKLLNEIRNETDQEKREALLIVLQPWKNTTFLLNTFLELSLLNIDTWEELSWAIEQRWIRDCKQIVEFIKVNWEAIQDIYANCRHKDIDSAAELKGTNWMDILRHFTPDLENRKVTSECAEQTKLYFDISEEQLTGTTPNMEAKNYDGVELREWLLKRHFT